MSKYKLDTMLRSSIVIDKCFLQGSKTDRIHELARSKRLLVSDALFYELLTDSEPSRSRIFAKFPPGLNPIDFVSHVGELMSYEINHQRASGKPSAHRIDVKFEFNRALATGGYELPIAAQSAIQEKSDEIRADVESSIDLARTIPKFFPDLLTGSQADQLSQRQEAEALVASRDSFREFYASLESPDKERPFPPVDLVDQNWAIYRWLQIHFLFALDLYVRYGGRLPDKPSAKTLEKLEHDVLDAQLLALGCLEGSFATTEKKLVRWWRILLPEGVLYC